MTFVWLTPLIIFTLFLTVILYQGSIFTRQQISDNILADKHAKPIDPIDGDSDRARDETGSLDLRDRPRMSSLSELQPRGNDQLSRSKT